MTYQMLPISPYQPTALETALGFYALEQLGKKYRASEAENERLDKLSISELVDEIFVNYAINQQD
jgi:hypothetical protein